MNKGTRDRGMGEIVQTVARWLRGFILVYGIYVMLYGHVTPGGGFAGGVIIASSFILLTLAGGRELGLSFFSKRAASYLACAGVLIFLAVAWIAMWPAGGAFLQNFIGASEESRFTLLSAGTVSISEVGIGLEVASLLFLVFAVLAAFEIIAANGKREDEDS